MDQEDCNTSWVGECMGMYGYLTMHAGESNNETPRGGYQPLLPSPEKKQLAGKMTSIITPTCRRGSQLEQEQCACRIAKRPCHTRHTPSRARGRVTYLCPVLAVSWSCVALGVCRAQVAVATDAPVFLFFLSHPNDAVFRSQRESRDVSLRVDDGCAVMVVLIDMSRL